MENTKNPSLLILEQGDITESNAQAIFSATNPDLILEAAVVCALRKKGGSKIQKECDRIGDCAVGDTVITSTRNLK